MTETLEEMIERHEGTRLFPYVDCCGKSWRSCVCVNKGKLTIGVGRNLDDVGISADEAQVLLGHDVARVQRELDEALPWWREQPQAVQDALTDLGFNLGVLTPHDKAKLLTFTFTLSLIRSGRYEDAAANLQKTPWFKQVGQRGPEIVGMIRGSTEA